MEAGDKERLSPSSILLSFKPSESMGAGDKEKGRTKICSGFSETQKRSRMLVRTLPDDVVLEILKRLPVKDVLKFQSICRRWKDLISTQYFKQMHLMKTCGPPMMILVEKNELLQLDRSGAAPKKIAMKKVWPSIPSSFDFFLSYHGLIILTKRHEYRSNPDYTILNPITGDKVTIKHVKSGFGICGMFFNTLIKEYCVLWGSFQRGKIQFKLLILGAQPHFRDLKQPTFYTRKPRYPPVIIEDDATMYWHLRPHGVDEFIAFRGQFCSCERQIMAFNIQTEEFTLMPHPGPRVDCHNLNHLYMHIVKMSGRLSFVQMTNRDVPFFLNIWTLNDSASGLWEKTHTSVAIGLDIFCWRSTSSFESIGALEVKEGELLLHFKCPTSKGSRQGIYAYNLVLGTFRSIYYSTDNYTPRIPIYEPSFVYLQNHKIRFPYT